MNDLMYINGMKINKGDIIDMDDGDQRHQVVCLVDSPRKVKRTNSGWLGAYTTPIDNPKLLVFSNIEILKDKSTTLIARGNVAENHPCATFIRSVKSLDYDDLFFYPVRRDPK